MALDYVTLVLDVADGTGAQESQGTAVLTPSSVERAAGGPITSRDQVPVSFRAGAYPTVSILATSNAGLTPGPGEWTWHITFAGQNAPLDPFDFALDIANGSTQKLSDMIPVAAGTVTSPFMPLPSGTPHAGQVPIATGTGEASAWTDLTSVQSVNGHVGVVVLGPADVGADAAGAAAAEASRATGAEALLAPLASPHLTGSPTAPTASPGANSTQVATTAYADAAAAAEAVRAGAAEAALVPKSGGTMTGALTLFNDPASNLEAATKHYVDVTAAAGGSVTIDTNNADIQPLGAQAAGSIGEAADAGHVHPVAGILQAADNLSDVASATTSRTNLGLGSAATHAASDFATASSLAAEASRATAAESLLAPLASPALTGTPTAPTKAPLTNSTDVATTAYADAATAAEAARATGAEALKAPLASPALTGNPTAPTQTPGSNSTRVATTAYADAATASEQSRAVTAEGLLAPKASPVFTGSPVAPTPSSGDSSTAIATTAFVAFGFADLVNNQSVGGVKTFTGEVVVPAPSAASDAATKAYVDATAQGLSVKQSARLATAAPLPSNTYSNGSSGAGATLTGVATGVLTVDGQAVALNDRVLVKDEVAGADNGLYVCAVAGAAGVAYVLTRAPGMDSAAEIPGAFCFVEEGASNAGAGFAVASAGPFTVGTTAITWTQFSGAGEVTAGTGLTKTGNTLNADLTVLAPLASPALTGSPTAPTKSAGDNSTKLATTAYADAATTVEASRAAGAEALLAPKASPVLTGVPTAPTATALTNTTQVATTAYADAAVTAEASRATTAEALKAPLASPALTGSPTAPTQTAGDSTTKIATDAFVAAAVSTEQARAQAAEALLAPEASPALTGTPTAPTATALTSSTQVATTAYADAAVTAETSRATTAEGLAALKASNLSDLASAATARTNLGLTGAATASLPLSVANGGIGGSTRNFAGLLTPTAVKTSAYTAAAGDFVPVDTTSGNVTVTLPNAPPDLTVVAVKHVIQGGTNTVTYACAGSDVFNKAGGSTSGILTLASQGAVLQYKASGGIWYVTADDLPLSQLDARYSPGEFDPSEYGTVDLTGAADSYTAIAAAIAAMPAAGGTLVFKRPGTYSFGTPLNLSGKHSVTITGGSNPTGGAGPPVILQYTGAGSQAINAQNTIGIYLQHVMLLFSNASFTGPLLDLSGPSSDTALFRVSDCYFGGTGGANSGNGVLLDKANSGTIEACNFDGCATGVIGVGTSGHYSNANTVKGCHFVGNTTKHISGPGQAWSIEGNTFEALASGAGGAIDGTIAATSGSRIQGNWFGDNSANSGTLINIGGGGNEITGNYFGLYAQAGSTMTAINVLSSADGIVIKGNWFGNGLNGIVFGAIPPVNYDIRGNYFGNVTNPLPAAPLVGGASVPIATTLADASTVAVNAALGNLFRVTLGGNRTLGNPTNPADGQEMIVEVTQPASGGPYTLAYGSAYVFSGGLPSPTLSSGASVTDILKFIYHGSTSTWRFIAFLNGFASGT